MCDSRVTATDKTQAIETEFCGSEEHFLMRFEKVPEKLSLNIFEDVRYPSMFIYAFVHY